MDREVQTVDNKSEFRKYSVAGGRIVPGIEDNTVAMTCTQWE